jgi:predicted N-acyltransferase
MAHNKAQAELRESLRAAKREAVREEREKVLKRGVMLKQLEQDKVGEVEVYLAAEKQKRLVKSDRFV